MYCFSTYWVNSCMLFYIKLFKVLSCISRSSHALSHPVVSGCCVEQCRWRTLVSSQKVLWLGWRPGTVDCRVRRCVVRLQGLVVEWHAHTATCFLVFSVITEPERLFCWPLPEFLNVGWRQSGVQEETFEDLTASYFHSYLFEHSVAFGREIDVCVQHPSWPRICEAFKPYM